MMLIKKSTNQGKGKVSFWTVSVLVVLMLLSAFMAPKKQTYQYNYQVGDITRMDIIAPYDFDILKPQSAITREQNEAKKKVPFVFSEEESVVSEQIDRTELFFQMAKTLDQRYNKFQSSKQIRRIQRFSTDDFEKLNESVRTDSNAYVAITSAFEEQYDIRVEESPFTEMYRPGESRRIPLDSLRLNFITHLTAMYESGITDIPLDSILSAQISVRKQGVETPATVKNMFDRTMATEQLTESLAKDYEIYSQKILISRIARLLVKPNMIYDKERTTTRQNDVIGRIPLVAGKVFKDEKIVGANTLITPEIYQKIYSLNYAEEKRGENLQGLNAVLKVLGDILIMSLLYMIFALFLMMYDKTIFKDVNRFLLLIICIVIALGLGSAIAILAPAQMILVPITITAMLLMIFFDERVALMGSSIVLLVLSYIMGGSFRFILMHAFPMVMAIIALRRSRSRENVLRPLLFILIGYFVSVSAMNIASLEPIEKTLTMIGFAFGNAIVSVLLSNGLMMMIERMFGVTTSLSLLELSDMNRPLLKRLSLEAPGTFNHSIVVGNLLEAAAENIGADSLLARVGAYYHDIGKLSKPDYFVENLQGGINKLDQLKPHMAAKVIISHVRNGLELAEQEKLPDVIKDFIATHHGTMTVDFFYKKAIEESGEDAIHENEFKYPGPKPRTKETALLMIVEAAEAAVRSLPKATPRNIDAKINEVIAKRLNSGQLDECPLKFADLTKISSAIYPLLVGLYHERVPYPEDKKPEDKKQDDKKGDEKKTEPLDMKEEKA